MPESAAGGCGGAEGLLGVGLVAAGQGGVVAGPEGHAPRLRGHEDAVAPHDRRGDAEAAEARLPGDVARAPPRREPRVRRDAGALGSPPLRPLVAARGAGGEDEREGGATHEPAQTHAILLALAEKPGGGISSRDIRPPRARAASLTATYSILHFDGRLQRLPLGHEGVHLVEQLLPVGHRLVGAARDRRRSRGRPSGASTSLTRCSFSPIWRSSSARRALALRASFSRARGSAAAVGRSRGASGIVARAPGGLGAGAPASAVAGVGRGLGGLRCRGGQPRRLARRRRRPAARGRHAGARRGQRRGRGPAPAASSSRGSPRTRRGTAGPGRRPTSTTLVASLSTK